MRRPPADCRNSRKARSETKVFGDAMSPFIMKRRDIARETRTDGFQHIHGVIPAVSEQARLTAQFGRPQS